MEPLGYRFLWNEPRDTFRPAKTFLPAASHVMGPQQELTLQWHLMKGVRGRVEGWYLRVNSVWNGYFPLSIFRARGQPSLADHAMSCENV
jgi:hypothetical protein